MKPALIGSVVLMSLAGAAAVGMMTPTPARIAAVAERPAFQPSRASATPAVAPVAVPARATVAPPAPTAKPSSVDAARPPVPLQVTHRRPLPDKPVVSDSKADAATAEKTDAAPDGKSQQAAKAAIEADGYKSVQMLGQGSNGVWRASALRGKTRIVVNVDQAGNVFTE